VPVALRVCASMPKVNGQQRADSNADYIGSHRQP
jgi:hypothetical protein